MRSNGIGNPGIGDAMKTAKNANATNELSIFFMRYGAVLQAVANYVHARVQRGQQYTPTKEAAQWVANDLPDLYRSTFGKTPKRLKAWRVMTMLSTAAYLEAYEALDIKVCRGRGITSIVKPRKVAKLTVLKGGKG